MALPTPLTPAQVEGAADVAEVPVLFRTGPHAGTALLVAKNDPNLQNAIDSGDIVADPSLDATPPGQITPVFKTITPNTSPDGRSVNVIIAGTGFLSINDPYMELARGGSTIDDSPTGIAVTDTEIRATFSIPASSAGPASVDVYADNGSGPKLVSMPFNITAAAPTNTLPPTISGTPTVGQVLTVADGTWTGSPTFTRQWLRGAAEIAGATGTTYTLVGADDGASISCKVTGTNAGGSISATSAAVGPVATA